jgi:hypothetical protein
MVKPMCAAGKAAKMGRLAHQPLSSVLRALRQGKHQAYQVDLTVQAGFGKDGRQVSTGGFFRNAQVVRAFAQGAAARQQQGKFRLPAG